MASASVGLGRPSVAVSEVQPLGRRWAVSVSCRLNAVVPQRRCRTATDDVWRGHEAAVARCVTVTRHHCLTEHIAARRGIHTAAASARTGEIEPDTRTTQVVWRHRRLGLVFDVCRCRVQMSKRAGDDRSRRMGRGRGDRRKDRSDWRWTFQWRTTTNSQSTTSYSLHNKHQLAATWINRLE